MGRCDVGTGEPSERDSVLNREEGKGQHPIFHIMLHMCTTLTNMQMVHMHPHKHSKIKTQWLYNIVLTQRKHMRPFTLRCSHGEDVVPSPLIHTSVYQEVWMSP